MLRYKLAILLVLISITSYGQPMRNLLLKKASGALSTLSWSTTNHGSSQSVGGTGNNTLTNATGTTNYGIGNVGHTGLGTYCFEVKMTTVGVLPIIGIAKFTSQSFNTYCGADANSVAWYQSAGVGYVISGGSANSGYSVFANPVNHYIEVVLNLTAQTITFYLDGVQSTGSTTFFTGFPTYTWYPAAGYASDVYVINGTVSTMAHIPSGMTSANNW